MSNKDIVKAIFPKARQESYKTGFPQKKYYLIRNGRESMYLAEGETAAKAWKNALPVALKRAAKAVEHFEKQNGCAERGT